MKKAVNVQLHISLNGMKDSEVEVMMDKTYNTSVHVSFQNPVNTPVKACEFCLLSLSLEGIYLKVFSKILQYWTKKSSMYIIHY